MIQVNFPFWGPLLFKTNINKDQLNRLNILCVKNKEKNNKDTVAHIQEQYKIHNLKFEEILKPQLMAFNETYYQYYLKRINGLTTTTVWVNFMKKGEFNPLHIHGDCDFSSVLYLNVPKKIKEENQKFLGRGAGPGAIEFFYGEESKNVLSYYSHFPQEGDFFIFPNTLKHMVSPFKSNVTRVSIAANFKLK
jgi:uncharacterized protein (TIGR02466 family)